MAEVEKKLGSVTVKALMLVEVTHPSPWSAGDTVERLHRSAVDEMRRAISSHPRHGLGGDTHIKIVAVQKIVCVSHEVDT